MQLRVLILVLLISKWAFPQTNDNVKKVEIDLFTGYYEQEGDHSAVEGGIGTQKLKASESVIFIHIVPDTINTYDVNIGFDACSSASSDKIDKYTSSASYVSSASYNDFRPNFNVMYSRNINNQIASVKFAFSHEFDVNSVSAGVNYSRSFNRDNTELSLGYDFFYDTWLLIYPAELRNRPEYETEGDDRYDKDVRKTNTLSFVYSQVVNRRMQFAILSDYVWQQGILNTPFHRVYFDDGIPIDLEKYKTVKAEYLPRSRYKLPVGARVNWYVCDFLITNFYYRYYYDNFGISSNTFEVRTPLKLGNSFVVSPSYRYYNQTASDYFAAYGEHKLSDTYFTSDYDLSKFDSHKLGIGVKFAPYYGIGRMNIPSKQRQTVFKSFEFNYSKYIRSDGLDANIFSFMLSLKY